MSWRRRVAWTLLGLALSLAIPVLAALVLLGTESGSRWLLTRMAMFSEDIGISLQFDQIKGHFLRDLRLSGLSIGLAAQTIQVGELRLLWRPLALVERRFHVESLTLSEVRYEGEPAPQAEEEPTELRLPDLALPLAVRVERFRLDGLTLRQGDARFTLTSLNLEAELRRDKWVFTNVAVSGEELGLTGDLAFEPQAPHGIGGAVSGWGLAPEVGRVEATAGISGTALEPELDLTLTAPYRIDAAAQADLTEPEPRFAFTARWPRLVWSPTGEPQVESLHGELQVEGTPDAYRLRLASQVRGRQVPESRLEVRGRGSTEGLVLEPLVVALLEGRVEVQGKLSWAPEVTWDLALSAADLNPGALAPDWSGRLSVRGTSAGRLTSDGPVARIEIERLDGRLGEQVMELTAAADIDYGSTPPRIVARAEWPRLTWPLSGAPQVESLEGDLTVDGSPDDYRVGLTTRVLGPQVPETQVDLRAQGSTEELRLEPLALALLTGEVQATGALSWAPQIAWDLVVTADGIDPGGLAPAWRGNLHARIASGGKLSESGPVGQARIERLDGTLRGQPTRAAGDLEYRPGRVVARALEVASGPNRVTVDGEAGEQLSLQFAIDAPELAAAYPGLSGALRGGGTLSGSRQSPDLDASLEAVGVRYETLEIGRLDLAARWQASGARVVLEGTDWQVADVRIDQTKARLEGLPEAHNLVLAATGPALAVGATARGGWSKGLWDGTLERLDLQQAQAGAWRLAAPVRVRGGPALAETEELCLAQPPAQACVVGGWRAEPRIDVRAKLERLPMARLAPLLPDGLGVEGELNLAAAVSGTPEQPRATFRVRPGDGRLRVRVEEEPIEIAYRDVRVDGEFAEDRGFAEIGLKLGADGVADGRVTLGPAPSRALDGEIVARFPDLSLVSGFVPDLAAVKGRLIADLKLGGQLETPQVEGELRIEEGGARLPAAGLELTNVGVTVRGDGLGPLRIDGGANSGEGRLSLFGQIDLAATRRPAVDLRIQGEDFQAVRLPEATVAVSPDLRLAGAAPFRLTGRLRIPSARIELRTLPTPTVPVSADEVIVGEGAEPDQATAGRTTQLDADVRIELGEEVRFESFGLEARLTGALDALLDERGQQLHGRVQLEEGQYRAFGQDLTIEQGRLVFAGPPSSPAIDLRAVRVSRDRSVRAYLEVSGPLTQPQTRVYSVPALPDGQALSYLLTGRGLDDANRGQGIDIASAAFSLGIAQGEPLLQSMAGRLGLDLLEVTTGDEGVESTALTVGKYLNPDLYVGYTQSLFDPTGSVLLRLRLSERLEVESRAGQRQSIDLFYRLEHD